jgi:hypothetical protein
VHINVSAPNEQARSAAVPPSSAGRVTADGRRIYRLSSPLIIWWTWVGVIVLGLGDLVIQGHNWISLKFGLGLLAATGAVYACTLWSKVIADDGGISVLNPIRRFRIPWGAVNGIFLADSVEVVCARRAPKSDKTVYSWALSSPRRSRARAQLRGQHWDRGARSRPSSYDRLPDAAKSVVKLTTAEIMARELGELSEQARSRSAGTATGSGVIGKATTDSGVTGQAADLQEAGSSGPDNHQPAGSGSGDVMSSGWAWQPLAAFLVPAVVFAVIQLVR